jgi:hypothetical protein
MAAQAHRRSAPFLREQFLVGGFADGREACLLRHTFAH